ncbi:ribosomal protein [Cyclospora cayetanensis]|uniref:Large ribosomal subunit protein uL11m n=1 Tax=Cyclospora cayetanensis TaxID=88456 RepID=A0A1D3CWM5_9EIME|nr:ribosomal protein [Cyclospora cayetanensis]
MSSNLGRFRLIVPAANAKPSPSIGQTLGPLGINMMAFCKEFNARTAKVRPDVPVQVTIVPNPDRTFKFSLRAPSSTWFLLRTARCPMGSEQAGKQVVGNVTLKEIYHIAKCKSMDWPLIGVSLQGICRSLIGSAKAMGIEVTPELQPAFSKRDYTPVENLEQMRKDLRQKRKAARRASAKS